MTANRRVSRAIGSEFSSSSLENCPHMSASSVLFNPPIPGSNKRRGPGRPRGSGDKRKRKTPNRAHLTKKAKMSDAKRKADAMRKMMEEEDKEWAQEHDRQEKAGGNDDDEEERPIMSVEEERDRMPDIEWPATLVMIGKKFAGKTTALLNFIDPNDFDNVFIVTKTKHKHNLDKLAKGPEYILDDMSDEFIELLIDHQRETEAKTLILFDDFIGMEWQPRYSPKMKLLAASGRNFNLSIIFSSQDMVEVPTIIRRNAEYLLLGNNYENTVELLSKQLALPGMGKRQFRLLLEKISKRKDHEFLYVDDRHQDWWVWKPQHIPELDGNKGADPKFDMSKKRKRGNDADEISMSRATQDAKRSRKD